MTSVTVISPADRQRATSTMMLAFASDPVVRWVLQEPHAYAEYWPPIIDAFAGAAFESGTAHASAGFAAVALWLPPGVGSDEVTMSALEEGASGPPDLDGFFGQMGGSTVRRAGGSTPATCTRTCDRDGVPAYLEATAPRNRDLYARHGFEEIGVIQHGGSPPMWPMLRQPR